MPPSSPQPPRKATRHDVAVMAGVSDPVVSYTLNGKAPVAPETAERVGEAIRVLGYRPNHTARALKSGSSRAIALIGPRGEDPAFSNPYFAEFAATAEEMARQRGFAFYMASYAVGSETVVDRLREFADRQIDGALILPGEGHDVTAADEVGVPWVQVNTADPIDGVSTVGVDVYQGGVDATTHLIEHGHRRIGFVGHLDGEARYRGWADTCRRHGLDPTPAVFSRFTRADGYAAAKQLIASGLMPSAVFAASDLMALGVLRALHEAGIEVPGQVALVSFDGSWEAEYTWPALTSVRQPIAQMAESALTQLLTRDAEPSHTIFPGELVVRTSCGNH